MLARAFLPLPGCVATEVDGVTPRQLLLHKSFTPTPLLPGNSRTQTITRAPARPLGNPSSDRLVSRTSYGDGPGQAGSLPGGVPSTNRTWRASIGTGGELTQTLSNRFLQPSRFLSACCS